MPGVSALAPLVAVVSVFGWISPSSAADNLLVNASFDDGLLGWETSGDVGIEPDGWDGGQSVLLRPQPGVTAELRQTVSGLEPRTRYTVAARVRTSDRLSPPILGIRDGVQIAKAHGWVAVGDGLRYAMGGGMRWVAVCDGWW